MNSIIRNAFAICSAVSILMVAGCGNPDMLIVRDQYWKAIEFDKDAEARLHALGEVSGHTIEFADMISPVSAKEIAARISEEDPGAALLSPLFSRYALEVAGIEHQRRIVAFAFGSRGSAEENLTIMKTDRREAFREVGLLCRRFLEYPGNEEKVVGGLFYSGGNERTAERLAFTEGLGSDLTERLFVRSFPQQDNIGEVNNYLATLNEEPVGLFVVSMAGLNRDVIASILAKSRALIIAERIDPPAGAYPYEDRIVAAINENWTALLSFDISSLGPEIVVEATLARGPAADMSSAGGTAAPESAMQEVGAETKEAQSEEAVSVAPWARDFFDQHDRGVRRAAPPQKE